MNLVSLDKQSLLDTIGAIDEAYLIEEIKEMVEEYLRDEKDRKFLREFMHDKLMIVEVVEAFLRLQHLGRDWKITKKEKTEGSSTQWYHISVTTSEGRSLSYSFYDWKSFSSKY